MKALSNRKIGTTRVQQTNERIVPKLRKFAGRKWVRRVFGPPIFYLYFLCISICIFRGLKDKQRYFKMDTFQKSGKSLFFVAI